MKCLSILSKFTFSVCSLPAEATTMVGIANQSQSTPDLIHIPSIMMLSLTKAPFPSLPPGRSQFTFFSKTAFRAIAMLGQLPLLQACPSIVCILPHCMSLLSCLSPTRHKLQESSG